jgi:membrane carboxypeptidase/penicillin-binding protein
VLGRRDLAGKTGTTNDSIDAWFAGYQAKLVGIAWIGYDQPKNLGNRETGGGLALPIWIGYMQKALKNIPIEERAVPEGVMLVGDEYYYAENPPGAGVNNLDAPGHGTPAEEKAGRRQERAVLTAGRRTGMSAGANAVQARLTWLPPWALTISDSEANSSVLSRVLIHRPSICR